MIYDVKAKIIKNKKLTPSIYYLELEIPKLASRLVPGQFVHVRVLGTTDPLLRRPLSVNKIIGKKNIGIVYKVVGKGTNLLREMAQGEMLEVLGPLGNGFDLKKLKGEVGDDVIKAIQLVREEKVKLDPGYDGEYGKISVDLKKIKPEQKKLF